ncbi:MAG: MEMO1 family protein, partial [Dehalococcoidia bacterium]|nr:MEMO1 family protein [Dehalococcoidia bacterium]
MNLNPKLRQPIEMHPATRGDQQGVLLRDPLALTNLTLFVPQPLAPFLTLCDGTRDIPALRTALMLRTGVYVGDNAVQELLAKLDEVLMLENERFLTARSRVRDEFRAAPCRPATTMGGSYPDKPDELCALLEKNLSAAKAEKVSQVRGIVCPHIDFPRGSPVYAGVWQAAREAVINAEL